MDIPSAWYVSLQISVAYACTKTNKQKAVQFLIAPKAHHQKKHNTIYSQNVGITLTVASMPLKLPRRKRIDRANQKFVLNPNPIPNMILNTNQTSLVDVNC